MKVLGWSVVAGLCCLLVVGCTSSGGATAPSAAATDVAAAPAPAKKPFVAPDWESEQYQNPDYGFSVHYPVDFQEQPVQDGGLFSAASPQQVPRMDINLVPSSGASIDEIGAQLVQAMETLGGGEAQVTSSKMTKLADEVTEAMEWVMEWTFQGFPLQSYVLGTEVESQVVTVMVTGMQGGDVSDLSRIARTLHLP